MTRPVRDFCKRTIKERTKFLYGITSLFFGRRWGSAGDCDIQPIPRTLREAQPHDASNNMIADKKQFNYEHGFSYKFG